MCAAEIFEVLTACDDHGMIRRKRRFRYGSGPAIERLCFADASCFFGDHPEIVQRLGQLWMEGPEILFLTTKGALQQLIRGLEVASPGGTLRGVEQLKSILVFSHRLLRSTTLTGADV